MNNSKDNINIWIVNAKQNIFQKVIKPGVGGETYLKGEKKNVKKRTDSYLLS